MEKLNSVLNPLFMNTVAPENNSEEAKILKSSILAICCIKKQRCVEI